MSLQQPQSMVNYTDTGFKKIRAPQRVIDLLNKHWELNKDKKEQEVWFTGNIYVNHWKSPTYMVSVENSNLEGGGFDLKNEIWDAVKPTIENWTGMELQQTSMYGIRIYTTGAVLSPHVDRNPLISSCIINVAQDVDEDWPLEVIDRSGNAVNVTMSPGDMVLYESGSLIHARPFPLKGKYFANIFIHFEPTGRPLSDTDGSYLDDLDDFLPPYIMPNSPWAKEFAERNPHGWKRPSPSAPRQFSTPIDTHVAAAAGDVPRLEQIARTKKHTLHLKDENGWNSLHEAARGGHAEAAGLLVKYGADLNARTGLKNNGQSALNIALEHHSAKAPIVRYLMSAGAQNIAADEL